MKEAIAFFPFPPLSAKESKEIEAMLGLGDIKQSKVYQEAFQEGIQEGEKRAEKRGK
ncbi:hypothetical protein [Oscillatoria salina]|uniref:hypothetical protein n=1 Tax=Oscillatoria salina TaxID=331517 RepID=UPI001CCDF690|nr:hypothetical protein [Oscillatoria salina]